RRRSLGPLQVAVEARPKPDLRLERPEGGDEHADRDRAEEEHVDPNEERSPARDRDHDREQDRRREGDARPDSDHSALHAASAASTAARSACSLSIASIAAAFMSASISCGLKRARSNSVVSRLAARRPPVSSPSTLPRYSCGASNRRRGTPCAASARSIRAYAAITARRGSDSARRSSSASSRTSERTSATRQSLGSRRRRRISESKNAARATPPAP